MVKQIEAVKYPSGLGRFAREWLEALSAETGAFRIRKVEINPRCPKGAAGREWDLGMSIELAANRRILKWLIETKKQISPGAAIGLLEAMATSRGKANAILCSRYLSPRVAELCRERGIDYFDEAGNCWLRGPGFYIERTGRGNVRPDTRPIRRLFSPKASRIVRALLTQPSRGWQVQHLAGLTEAPVSLGLVSKVKQTLVEQGYATERGRLLYVRDPRALLEAWARAYRPHIEPIRLFVHGELPEVERTVDEWLTSNGLQHALTQFSGAWRTAPMLRYNRATFWVSPIPRAAWGALRQFRHAQRVDSGENVMLWETSDPAVFVGSRKLGDPPLETASTLQLYLDLRLLSGRGAEAATEIYDREIAATFSSVADDTSRPSREST